MNSFIRDYIYIGQLAVQPLLKKPIYENKTHHFLHTHTLLHLRLIITRRSEIDDVIVVEEQLEREGEQGFREGVGGVRPGHAGEVGQRGQSRRQPHRGGGQGPLPDPSRRPLPY